MISRPTINQK